MTESAVDESFWGPRRSPLVGVLAATVALMVAATMVGVVVLWPHGRTSRSHAFGPTKTVGAVVEKVSAVRCGGGSCRRVSVKLEHGRRTSFTIAGSFGSIALEPGDRIRVYENQLPPNAVGSDGRAPDRYAFSDFDRLGPMLWLALGFVALLLVTGRLHGLRALVGLVASLLIVIEFVIPAILHGRPPLAVAVVGAFAVMLVTMPLSYGLGAKMLSAWLGTAASLLLAAGLASGFAHVSHLSGASSDESVYLSAQSGLSLQGLLVAGMVIGALGVLVDLTVSQASTVIALRRANPLLGFGRLFRGALDVGHDHIAATVNTLVFAYAGASLPVLLIFTIGGVSFTDAVNGEAVAEQVMATLVGSIGLIASMPITTALAALLALRMDDRDLGELHAGHAH
jgi:uncharacterized membrane protein